MTSLIVKGLLIHLVYMKEVYYSQDIHNKLMEGGNPLVSLTTREHIKLNLSQVVESSMLLTIGRQIVTFRRRTRYFMMGVNLSVKVLGVMHLTQGTGLLKFLMDSGRAPDQPHLMNQGQSYREATTHMEGREEPLIRVDMEDNTMMVGRLGTMAIRDHRNLSHREMKGTSVEEMKLLLTRYGVLFKVMLYVDDNRDLTFRQRRDPLKRR